MERYLEQANKLISEAFRPNTKKGHEYALKIYTEVAEETESDPCSPTKELAAAYVTHLSQRFKTFKTVTTVLANLIATLKRSQINTSAFTTTEIIQLKFSLTKNMRNPIKKRPPVSTSTLRRIVEHLRQFKPNGYPLATAIIFLFNTGLRQSNIFPVTVKSFDPTRKVTRGDIDWRNDHYKITIKWAKANQTIDSKAQRIPRAMDPQICSYNSLWEMFVNSPKKGKNKPLICFPDGHPIPISYVTKIWKETMTELGIEAYQFSLHSLRRGHATHLMRIGVPDDKIAEHVGWKGKKSMYGYIPDPKQRNAYNALQLV